MKNKEYSDIALLKRIFKITKPFHRFYLIIFLIIVSVSLIGLASPYFFGKTIDSLSEGNINDSYIYIVLAIISLIFVLILNKFQASIEIKNINYSNQKFLSLWSIKKILKLSLGQFRNEHSGYRQKIFNKGEKALFDLMFTFIYSVFPLLISSLVAMIALFFIEWRLAAIISIGAILYVLYSYRINIKIIPDLKKMQELWGRNGKEHSEIIRYLYLIKANVQEKKMIKQYGETHNEIQEHGVPIWLGYIKDTFKRDVFVSSTARSVTLILGVYFTAQSILHPETVNIMTIGSLVTFFAWSGMVFDGLDRMGRLQRSIIRSLSEIRKFFELIDEKSTIEEVKNPLNPEKLEGRIEFKNISFTYPNSDEDKDEGVVLDNISFSVESGETCAFVGKSGSGKSTLVSLLLRAYDPDSGDILIDGNDLRLLGIKNYLKKVGVVEQDVELFDNTVKENILFSVDDHEKYLDEDLDNVISDSGVSEFNDRLTDGLDTLIGEKGIQLSGGQRQRLGIARVLAKKPDILIFDEATSNLDSSTESLIQESMNKALEGKTGIIIAHRLATVMNADKIVVFDKGKVVGIGTHKELIKDCKEYKELVKLQNLEN